MRVSALLRQAYARADTVVRELVEFGVVGAGAFVVDVATYNLAALVLGLGPLTSKTLSVLVATTFAYLGNRYWTFRHRERTGLRREYALFLGLNGVGLLIALACLGFTFYVLGFTSPLAQNVSANVVGLGLGTAFRFWSYRRFVFPERDGTGQVEIPEHATHTSGCTQLSKGRQPGLGWAASGRRRTWAPRVHDAPPPHLDTVSTGRRELS